MGQRPREPHVPGMPFNPDPRRDRSDRERRYRHTLREAFSQALAAGKARARPASGRTEEIAMNLPPVVSRQEWQAALEAHRIKEKDATRSRDELAAERRRLPRVRIEKDYVFKGPDGEVSFGDLFGRRRQLILYHFMFGPGAAQGCDGCSMVIDNIGHLAHVYARDTSFAVISRAPIDKIEPYRKRMGWTVPWFSSFETDFNHDFEVGPKAPQEGEYQDGESFGLSVFLRDGEHIYRTYFTKGRGVETLGSNWTFLDLTPFGRQEEWEDSPEGYPQTPPYKWWRRHDEYETTTPSTRLSEEEQVRRCIDSWTNALRARDLDGVLVHYAPNLLAFDLAPPLEHKRDDLAKGLKEWFATWEGPIGFEMRDLEVTANGDLAFAHSLNRLSGRRTDGQHTDVWTRATVCFRKLAGRWMVVHEHSSVPFYMDGSFRAAVDLHP
jgi:predicted dithiol-disulfide oxidoreductase (DUF899 family)/ketosteroid isomerase-like protein